MVLPDMMTQNSYIFLNSSLQHPTLSHIPTYTNTLGWQIPSLITAVSWSSHPLPSYLSPGSGLFFMSQTLGLASKPFSLFCQFNLQSFLVPCVVTSRLSLCSQESHIQTQPLFPGLLWLHLLLFPFTPSTFRQTFGYIALFSSASITDFPPLPLPCHSSYGQKCPTQIPAPARYSFSQSHIIKICSLVVLIDPESL